MFHQSITRLQHLCDTIPALIAELPEDEFANKPAPGKWSKKEVLGHLIDSATNNHQRFVRAQFEDAPCIGYDQNKWNACSRYNQMSTRHLIIFWTAYNRHLLEVVRNIPPADLCKLCDSGDPEKRSIEWLFIDYVKHLEHHLEQIVEYAVV